MHRPLFAGVLVALLPVMASSQSAMSYECSYGDLKRRVIIYSEPGVSVPCEVHYYKDTEAPGERDVLWRAVNEAGYCESRAAEFRVQLTEWGWTCTDGADAPEEMMNDAEPLDDDAVDDTDMLSPAGEEELDDAI